MHSYVSEETCLFIIFLRYTHRVVPSLDSNSKGKSNLCSILFSFSSHEDVFERLELLPLYNMIIGSLSISCISFAMLCEERILWFIIDYLYSSVCIDDSEDVLCCKKCRWRSVPLFTIRTQTRRKAILYDHADCWCR